MDTCLSVASTHPPTCAQFREEEELIAVLLALCLADGGSGDELHNVRVAGELLGHGNFLSDGVTGHLVRPEQPLVMEWQNKHG